MGAAEAERFLSVAGRAMTPSMAERDPDQAAGAERATDYDPAEDPDADPGELYPEGRTSAHEETHEPTGHHPDPDLDES
jgi:hypothetical protein